MPYKTRELVLRSYHLLRYWICKSEFISSPPPLHMKHTIASFQSPQFEIEKENYFGRIQTPVSCYMNGVFVSDSHENVSNESPKRYQIS